MKILKENSIKEGVSKTPYTMVIDYYLYDGGIKKRINREHDAYNHPLKLSANTEVVTEKYKNSDGSVLLKVFTVSYIGRDSGGDYFALSYLGFDSEAEMHSQGWK